LWFREIVSRRVRKKAPAESLAEQEEAAGGKRVQAEILRTIDQGTADAAPFDRGFPKPTEAPIRFSFSLGDDSPAQRIAPDYFDQYGW